MVHVVVPVSFEPRRVQQDAGVWTESTEILASFGLHDQRTPPATIFGGLILQTLTNLFETVGLHSRNMRACARVVFQSQSDRQRRDKVDVADVDEQLPAVVSELAEAEVRVAVRVCWIEDRGFHKTRSRVDEELQGLADGEPDATTSDAWDGGCDSVSWDTKWNGDIFRQRLTSRRRG